MSYIDTRDLIEERDNLKEQILDNFNDTFNTELYEFDDIETYLNDEASENIDEDERNDFEAYWEDEYAKIEEIDHVEDMVGSDIYHGVTLISEDDFKEYVQDLIEDSYIEIGKLPSWIEIDWQQTAENVKQDYSVLEYDGETYYFQ